MTETKYLPGALGHGGPNWPIRALCASAHVYTSAWGATCWHHPEAVSAQMARRSNVHDLPFLDNRAVIFMKRPPVIELQYSFVQTALKIVPCFAEPARMHMREVTPSPLPTSII
jgi:hypothetical protein